MPCTGPVLTEEIRAAFDANAQTRRSKRGGGGGGGGGDDG
eukprot:CAMPEP_0197594396 /NCGR_PEP_ID=MMETSP1326-20131121/20456_1 /TAXON_ID=1155430 /ORGANISM="Genus nov. species nov., Strain RCC2288" /LENGTH=39 /DNA_ID= /DNA_START= /DNA_END= /DNA_ORIENTATION=